MDDFGSSDGMDIFSIPFFYISFKRDLEVEKHYHSYGFRDVRWFQAVDGRKFDPRKLREDGLITIRAFDDLMAGRREHPGLTTLGAVGCTMSHFSLWKKCVDENLPFIGILEPDGRFVKDKLSSEDVKNIQKVLRKPKSIFLSPISKISRQDHRVHFFGLHFYICSRDACSELIDGAFPMEVQTDWWVGHLATMGKINVEGYKINQQLSHPSSIQTMCFTCILPTGPAFYVSVIGMILIGILVIACTTKWLTGCKKDLQTCKLTKN
jgi:hypothetical protein